MSYLPSVQNLEDLRDAFSDDFFKGFAMYPTYQLLEGGPQMRLELKEDDKNFFVKAEIPGVKKEDIKVSVDGSRVSLSVEVKKEREEKEAPRSSEVSGITAALHAASHWRKA